MPSLSITFLGTREFNQQRSSKELKRSMQFPAYRPRRLRRNETLRQLIRETTLTPGNLIYPLFVGPGTNVARPISSMPGIAQLSVDRAVEECREDLAEAIALILEDRREDGLRGAPPDAIRDVVVVQ